jgi:SpoVK/Ycf46/Vps4 family AAA+-type ATPase
MIVGPTGSGKTHLAKHMAEALGWRHFLINSPAWIIMGAREQATWKALAYWLATIEPGKPFVIILDEIDKIYANTEWSRNLRSELFALMDGQTPEQLNQDMDEALPTLDCSRIRKDCLIVACGAFQDAFESNPTLGFQSESTQPKSTGDLAKHLQRELVNRFDNDVLILPDLNEADYHRMVETASKNMPEKLVTVFNKTANKLLQQACKDRTAARFIETVVGRMYFDLARENTELEELWRLRETLNKKNFELSKML